MKNPFRYFNSSPEIIRLTVMMYVRYPLSLRQVEDLLSDQDQGILSQAKTNSEEKQGITDLAESEPVESAQPIGVR